MMEDIVNEINDLFLLCRLCIVGDGKFAIVPKTKIHTSIKEIFGVKIDPYDGLPQLLCVQCKEKLLEIQNIRATFTTNQEILAALKTNYTQNTEHRTIKTEPPDELSETVCENDVQNTNSPAVPTETAAKQQSTIDKIVSEKTTNETEKTDTTIKIETNVEDSSEPTSELVHPEADDLDLYQYHCRLCNDSFNSVFKLRDHSKSHENVIQLQRRYTPYSCSVRIHRMKEYSAAANVNDNYQFSHPLFFIRKRINRELTEKDNAGPQTNTDTDSYGDVNLMSDNTLEAGGDSIPKDCSKLTQNNEDIMECDVAPQTEKESTRESEIKSETDTTSIFKPTIQYDPWSNPTSSNFGSILREACDVLEDDQEVESKPYSLNSINLEKIAEIIQHRISKYCLAEEEAELELVQNVLIHLCKRQIRLTWKESTLCPEIVFKSSDQTIIRPSNLDEFELVPEPPKPACRKIGPKLTEVPFKQICCLKTKPFKKIAMENKLEGFESVQNSMGNVVLNNQSEKLDKTVIKKQSNMSDVTAAKLSSANINNIENAGTHFEAIAESQYDANEESQFDANEESQFDANEESQFDANEESQFDANEESQFDANEESQFDVNADGQVDGNSNTTNTTFDTNNTENNILASGDPVVTDNSENLNSNNTSAVIPIIVSTRTLEPSSAATESTSVYIDLEDNEHTVNSDHFSEPVTPIMFFHYVLEKEGFFLTFEKQSPQAATLVCYKKNVDDIGDFIITISIDDIIFYMEICQGKKTIDLTKESLITQWLLLSSVNQPKVETIMKNYARRFNIDTEKIEKFIKITRSISGTIQDDSVWMEAPNKFFF